jgi:adenine/guanine/hypoxanthine permease
MGLNAYFAYQVVGFHGTGKISYGQALAAVFIEGFIFFALSILGMRQWLVRILPTSIKVASGCGIGLFLSLIGLSYSAGIGAITGGATATPLDIAGCPSQYLDPVTGACTSHKMQNPQVFESTCLRKHLTLPALDRNLPWRYSYYLPHGL